MMPGMSEPSTPLRRHLRHRRRAILLVALVAFGLAQVLAIAHAARHAGSDPGGPASNGHVQLCTDCASMLPLLVVAGAAGVALALLHPSGTVLLTAAASRPALAPVHRAFRSRAPPSARR